MTKTKAERTKESTIRRTENDEKFIRSMISVTEDKMFNPFQIESEWTTEEPKPLCNIETGLVASNEVVTWASTIVRNGKKQLDDFITKRLNLQEEELFEPITKNKIRSFASEKKDKVKKDGKMSSVDLDRQIMSRLVVV